MRIINFLTLATIFLLSGCSTLGVPDYLANFNPSNYQGCTVVEYRVPASQSKELSGATVKWWDCKDKATVDASVTLASGVVFSYNATDVNGSIAARIRADVEKKFADAGVQVTPAIVDGLVKMIVGGI